MKKYKLINLSEFSYCAKTVAAAAIVILLQVFSASSQVFAASGSGASNSETVATVPLFVSRRADPISMLSMTKDHRIYNKAYADYDDVDGDGKIDNGYDDSIGYYGYFDNRKCYTYSTGDGYFVPDSPVPNIADHVCSGALWSGNFLNWATMTRMDVLRRALYGGKRLSDANGLTVLERAFLPADIHSFVKVFAPGDATEVNKYTPYNTTDISICNVSLENGGQYSQNLSLTQSPPLIRVAEGTWTLWASSEITQCAWGGVSRPDQATYELDTLRARIEVCKSGQLEPNCQTYPNGNRKPTGLLHSFSVNSDGESTIRFGLLSGSYINNFSGGVLRKNAYFLQGNLDGSGNPDTAKDEVDLQTGQFINQSNGDEGIINTLDRFRITQHRPPQGYRSSCDHCGNWGNPLGEIYTETLRYLTRESTGANTPTADFDTDDSGRITGLPNPAWVDPYSNDNWCAAPSVILISTGLNSFDDDEYSTASDIPGISGTGDIDLSTNAIGAQEGLHNKNYFVGNGSATSDDQCTAKLVSQLSDATGFCPEEPSNRGTFDVAGLAFHAHTNDMRPDLTKPSGEEVKIDTYALALAQGLPRITLKNGISIVPACKRGSPTNDDNCSLGDLRIGDLTFDVNNDLIAGRVVYVWEDRNWGGDYDKDGIQYMEFCVGDACTPALPSNQAKLINAYPDHATGARMYMGHILGGSNSDGQTFTMTITGTHSSGSSCAASPRPPGVASGQRVGERACLTDDLNLLGTCTATSALNGGGFVEPPLIGSCSPDVPADQAVYPRHEMIITAGSSGVDSFESPLWYAAKYGSFTEASATPNDMPDDAFEWDVDGNGIPDNYFNVTDPTRLEAQLSSVFESILATSGSSSAVASNTTSLQTDTRVYQALFDSGVWTGDLLAIPVMFDGSFGSPVWNAATQIDNQNFSGSRKIVTFDPTAGSGGLGIPFRWADLNTAQQTLMDTNAISGTTDGRGEDRTNFIRGDRSHEVGQIAADANFRARDNVLGDFVDSAPFFVGEPLAGYPDALEANAYSTFAAANASRTPMVYIGANDGLLHAINSATGDEQFGYVPNEVMANLSELTDPGYSHNFYVNASPVATEAYYDNAWHTVLVSGLGAGGKAVFALDVTDPSTFAEGTAASRVLWEISSSDAGFADLGHTYSKPSIVRLGNGTWAAIFSNGYNSASGKAILYVVNIKTGALIQAIDVGVGSTSVPNGLGNSSSG